MPSRHPLPPFTGDLDALIDEARVILSLAPKAGCTSAELDLEDYAALVTVAEEARTMRRQLGAFGPLVDALKAAAGMRYYDVPPGGWYNRVPEATMRALLAALPTFEEDEPAAPTPAPPADLVAVDAALASPVGETPAPERCPSCDGAGEVDRGGDGFYIDCPVCRPPKVKQLQPRFRTASCIKTADELAPPSPTAPGTGRQALIEKS